MRLDTNLIRSLDLKIQWQKLSTEDKKTEGKKKGIKHQLPEYANIKQSHIHVLESQKKEQATKQKINFEEMYR